MFVTVDQNETCDLPVQEIIANIQKNTYVDMRTVWLNFSQAEAQKGLGQVQGGVWFRYSC